MGCDEVALRHSVCVVTLVLAFGLSVAGVASPWWRSVDEEHYGRCEGLWQRCIRLGKYDTTCTFTQRNSGLWRAVQVVELMSVALLTCGVTCLLVEVLCTPPCRPALGIPPSFVIAMLGGLTGMTGDLLYVGFTEYHTVHDANEHVYYWSFAWAVGGSCFSLFSALVIGLTARIVLPPAPRPKDYERRSAEEGPKHRDHDHFYNGAREPERVGSWRFYPSRRWQRRHCDDPNRMHFHPYAMNESVHRSRRHPYLGDDDRRPFESEPYRGSHIRYPGWYRSTPDRSSRRMSASRREQYHDVYEPQSRLYPNPKELDAQTYFGRESSVRGLHPRFVGHPYVLAPTAPEESDSRNSTRSSPEEQLPGYFSRTGSYPQAARESVAPEQTVALASEEAASGGPGSERGEHHRQARPGEHRPSTPAPQPLSSDTGRRSSSRNLSEYSMNVSTQTFPERAIRPGSSCASSASAMRHVQFEDERVWDPVNQSWGAPVTRRSAEVIPVHTFRPVHRPFQDEQDGAQHASLQPTAVRSPARASGQDVEQASHAERMGSIMQMLAAGHGQGQHSTQTTETERVAVLRQPPELRRPRPPSRRRPSLTLPPARAQEHHYHPGQRWEEWERHPSEARMVIKTRRDSDHDRFAFDDH